MAKRTVRLSDADCKKAKQGDQPLYDGNGGLRLVMSKTTPTKTWQYRINKATLKTTITIGKYTTDGKRVIISLAEARDKSNELAKLVAQGINPNEQKRQKRLEESRVKTFKQFAYLWYETAYSKNGVCSQTAEKTLGILENHVFPQIGSKPIDKITHNDLCKVIRTIEAKGLKDTPSATKGYLRRIFAKAFISGYITNDPTQYLNQEEFKKVTEESHPSLPLEKLPELHQRISNLDTTYGNTLGALFFKFMLHTFVRTSELRFARWEEFDFEKRTWTIPSTRSIVENCEFSNRGSKMKREHIVPLSQQAYAILLEIKKFSYRLSLNVFPKEGELTAFISGNTGTNYIKRLGYCTKKEFTAHGIRDMACSAISASNLFGIEIIEKQMSHETQNKVRKPCLLN